MQKILVVVDMQNDFIDGALGSAHATAIVPAVKAKIEGFEGRVIFTRDTHGADYSSTQEGKNLPVEHCIRDTAGWQISAELAPFCKEVVDKPTFGSVELAKMLCDIDSAEGIESITFIGLCTDICVISNAMLAKAFLPEVPVIVDAACCAGVTIESHKTALDAMRACQIAIEND
ncbi:MAG: cysteine hydrolase [Oscillospiraceae bacterium]|nr:cysteine hydrolase [Oscillospiraceae bacterium]